MKCWIWANNQYEILYDINFWEGWIWIWSEAVDLCPTRTEYDSCIIKPDLEYMYMTCNNMEIHPVIFSLDVMGLQNVPI